jgi:hypothetical protein
MIFTLRLKTIATMATLAAANTVLAQEAPNYSRDVAPILQAKCASCHNPEGERPELETAGEAMFRVDGLNGMARGQDIVIPPHGYQVLQGTHVLDSPAIIHSYRPHMHMRGRVMTMEAIYPDGRKEVLSQIDKYNHNWQISYIYADDSKPILPKGTVLEFSSVFDNTANNPINPDPEQWVVFGRRGVDEMNHAWLGMTYINEEQYGSAIAERRARQETLRVSQ